MSLPKRVHRVLPIFLIILACAAITGCSTGNQNSGLSLVDSQGRHPAGWVVPFPGPSPHSQTATFNFISGGTTGCTECHGASLDGGITGVSCMNASCHHGSAPNWSSPTVHGAFAKRAPGSSSFLSCQICHGTNFAGGLSGQSCFPCHGGARPHPAPPWINTGSTDNTHTNTDSSNARACDQCHHLGANSSLVPSPPASPGTPPGCFNGTLCHSGGGGGVASHPVPFFSATHFQATTATFTSNCGNCHTLTGTTTTGAPACSVCHTNAAVNPLVTKDCTSCHTAPPTGAAYPNIAGAHPTHIALDNTGTPISCATCHTGLGSGTLSHYTRAGTGRTPPADAAFDNTYNAASGASSFNTTSLTCLNVSCHGGQATPNWQTGTLNVNTQCTSCHAFNSGQFNEPVSGRHGDRNDHSVCTFCHNTTKLAAAGQHFANLATPAIETRASVTIGGTGTLIGEGNYTPGGTVGTGTCTPACHGTRSW